MNWLIAIATAFIPAVVSIICTVFLAKREDKNGVLARKQLKDAAIEKAAESISGEPMLVLGSPGTPIPLTGEVPFDQRSKNGDGSLKRRIKEHLEEAFAML